MRIYSENSYMGKKLIDMGSRYDAFELYQIYDKWSVAKQKAYDYCYDLYLKSSGHNSFSICSHNTFGFTVSWLCDDGLRIETPKNSYLVVFDN